MYRKSNRLSLKQVAAQVNVSPAMVSQVLNGKGRISEQRRNQILALLEENEYRPKYARNPFYFIVDLPRIEKAGKTQNVLEQLCGIQRVFEEQRLILHVEFISSSPTIEQLETIIHHKPGGVLLNTDAPFLNQACKMFHQAQIPIVQIGYDTENNNYNAVVLDSFIGAYTATKHLLNKGHKRIAIVRWLAGLAAINSNKKFAGYQTALADNDILFDEQLVKSLRATQGEKGWAPVRQLVKEFSGLNDPPTALFIDNSFISLSLLYPLPGELEMPAFIRNLDIVHFEDWSLKPVQDILTGKLFFPDFETTVVGIDWESLGQQAAKLLIDCAGASAAVPKIVRIAPSLYHVKNNHRQYIIENEGEDQ
ncbi:MAG TPA: LacI family DNA-binding transcriptional regulator [bacterium]|nr:LacI family DNA-binding transcriptional regulator [bacterium]HPN45738.1 LacI family DNA-binding transcriptional regulator [bacterium]